MLEREKILHAEVAYMPTKHFKGGVVGDRMRGIALTDSERHGLQPISETGFIWIDENTAHELGLVPLDFVGKPDIDDQLNDWLKEYVTDKQKFYVRINPNDKLKKATETMEVAKKSGVTSTDMFMQEFEKATVNHSIIRELKEIGANAGRERRTTFGKEGQTNVEFMRIAKELIDVFVSRSLPFIEKRPDLVQNIEDTASIVGDFFSLIKHGLFLSLEEEIPTYYFLVNHYSFNNFADEFIGLARQLSEGLRRLENGDDYRHFIYRQILKLKEPHQEKLKDDCKRFFVNLENVFK